MFSNFFKTTPRRRLIAYALVVIVAVVGLWRYQITSNEAHDAAEQAKATAVAEAKEDEVDEANMCLTAWDVREQIRDSVELSAEGNRQAFLDAARPFVRGNPNFPNYDKFVAEYDRTHTRWVERARDAIPNPECSRAKAKEKLKEGEATSGNVGRPGYHGRQNLHWPRLGPDTAQTWVYFENHLAPHQGPYLAWYANQLTQHPELAVRVVADCGTRRNCVQWFTKDFGAVGGLTWVSWGSGGHLLDSWVKLHPAIGTGSIGDLGSKRVVWHEGCHSTGQGFEEAYHFYCNSTYKAHHWATLSKYYHNDAG